jgi:hypothetical protein
VQSSSVAVVRSSNVITLPVDHGSTGSPTPPVCSGASYAAKSSPHNRRTDRQVPELADRADHDLPARALGEHLEAVAAVGDLIDADAAIAPGRRALEQAPGRPRRSNNSRTHGMVPPSKGGRPRRRRGRDRDAVELDVPRSGAGSAGWPAWCAR